MTKVYKFLKKATESYVKEHTCLLVSLFKRAGGLKHFLFTVSQLEDKRGEKLYGSPLSLLHI